MVDLDSGRKQVVAPQPCPKSGGTESGGESSADPGGGPDPAIDIERPDFFDTDCDGG